MIDDLRARLGAVGAILGIPVTVDEGSEWRIDGDRLHVGLDWYRQRGHPDREALGLTMLQLWQGIRGEREAPDRARRRRTLGRSMPFAEPLLEVVLRLQSMEELLAAMPGWRIAVMTAMQRSLPASWSELPRHVQWAALLIVLETEGAVPADLHPEVEEEFARLAEHASRSGVDPLRRVLAVDPSRSSLHRFERALALLLPPYERLLDLDRSERGLDIRAGVVTADADAVDAVLGASGGGDEGAGDDAGESLPGPVDTSGEAVEAAESDTEDRARSDDGRDSAEGADLFAAERAAFVAEVLPTPLPGGGSLVEAALEIANSSQPGRSDADSPRALSPDTRYPSGHSSARLREYRQTVDRLAPEIDRMRALWMRIIAERLAPRRAPGRRAEPEGEWLVDDALATAVAESFAGVSRPNAYRQREIRWRRTRRAGSTDYVLLIDRSASMTGPAARATADAVLIMLEGLSGAERDVQHAEILSGVAFGLDLRTALVFFDAEAHVIKPLSRGMNDETRAAVHRAILAPGGATNDAAALGEAARQLRVPQSGSVGSARATSDSPEGDGIERRRIVFVLSDGGTNDEAAAARAIRDLRRAGVTVHGVGIGSEEIVRRYAPTSTNIVDPRLLPEALHDLVERELPW